MKKSRLMVWLAALLLANLLAFQITCAYPVFGWHPQACLCDQCLAEFEADRMEGEQE